MSSIQDPERVGTVVIGGGQSGLSVGYHLARRRIPFVILEGNARVGDSWRQRWDSLHLFTPARYDGLAGMPFPGDPGAFPTKDEMAAYLETYAARFALPVRTSTRATRLVRQGDRYLVTTTRGQLLAEQVVVAMASYQKPRIPAFAAELDPRIAQLHSSEYRSPAQLRHGPVLIVGAGNSGADIAVEIARRGHETWMSGRDTGHVPFRLDSFLARHLLVPFLFRVVFHRVLTTSTPIGRRLRPKVIARGGPLIRVTPADLAAARVQRVPRTIGAQHGMPVLDDGRVLDAATVIWCTGFHPGFSWIGLPIFGADGEPAQERGIVAGAPGLYFVGLHFLHAMSSTMIHGVERDARHVAEAVARRVRSTTADPLAAIQPAA
ncbi:MAG TPA: NAD(P)-binding domain-containing protein [Gemmatimonadaceae bacterium]|nr:NAD(P)-binding domain-containing protein [Gemmatimonadaceae bacterium]